MTLHFIHIGKTGGTAIKRALRDAGAAYWKEEDAPTVPETPYGRIQLHRHSFRMHHVPPEDHVFFCLRDPVDRFVSAFYSRLNKGQPRYYFEWSEEERRAFETFPTPERLAGALASPDPEERALAEWALRNIRHMGSMQRFVGTPPQLRARLGQVVYIARQETLSTDWEQMKALLHLPPDAELPTARVGAHRRDPSLNAELDEASTAALREWYRQDYALLKYCDEVRASNGWGAGPAAPRARAAAPPAARPATEQRIDDGAELVRSVVAESSSRAELWSAFIQRIAARTVAEIGVYRGAFAAELLGSCPSIETYYMVDPWRHLEDWNKPANREDETFERFYAEAMKRTRDHESRRVVLRGRTTEVLDRIPDGRLDFAYVDGDHTLRGITVDLVRVHQKVRVGGWIAGDDFSPSIWQHGDGFEPTLVFPLAVYFAEAVGARIYGLPYRQFLIEKRPESGFEFVDLTGSYGTVELLGQVAPREAAGTGAPPQDGARGLLRRALRLARPQ